MILKKMCSIKPPETCHHQEHVRDAACYDCHAFEPGDSKRIVKEEEDLWFESVCLKLLKTLKYNKLMGIWEKIC